MLARPRMRPPSLISICHTAVSRTIAPKGMIGRPGNGESAEVKGPSFFLISQLGVVQ